MKTAIRLACLLSFVVMVTDCLAAVHHYRYEDVVRNTSGRVVSGVYCTVRSAADSSLATLYLGDTALTNIVNPVTSDAYGRFGFYIDPGEYFIEFERTGIIDYTQLGVNIAQQSDLGWPVIYNGAPNPSTTNFPGLLMYNPFGTSMNFWDGSTWLSLRDSSDPLQIVHSPSMPDTVDARGLVWYDQTNDDLFLYTGEVGREWLSTTVIGEGGGGGVLGDSTIVRVPAHDFMRNTQYPSFDLWYQDANVVGGFGRAMAGAFFPWLDNTDGDTPGRANLVIIVPDGYVAGTSFTVWAEFESNDVFLDTEVFVFEIGYEARRRYRNLPIVEGVDVRNLICTNNSVLRSKLAASALDVNDIEPATILTTAKITINGGSNITGITLQAGDLLGFYLERADILECNLTVHAVEITFDVE